MDSVTHIVIGAAIGEKFFPKLKRWQAATLGALANTIPDFDIFFSFLGGGADEGYLRIHRGYTHALLPQLAMALGLAALSARISKKVTFNKWLLFWAFSFLSHSLIDVCTNYGTRLFLPFTNEAYSLNAISIADLTLTLPLILFWIIRSFCTPPKAAYTNWLHICIAYFISYFTLCFGLKLTVNHQFKQSLQASNIKYTSYISNPTILNNMLWYCIATTDSGLYAAEYSLLDKNRLIPFDYYPRNAQIANSFADTAHVQLLKWFSGSNYIVNQSHPDTLRFYSVKFGRIDLDGGPDASKAFSFCYKLYPTTKGKFNLQWYQPPMNTSKAFTQLWQRIKGVK